MNTKEMHTARLADKLEAAMLQYPKARVCQLERQVQFERGRRHDVEKEMATLRQQFRASNSNNQ